MASHDRDQVLQDILEYARHARDESNSRMEVDTNDVELETRLDKAIKQLEGRVEEQRKVLEQIQGRSQRLSSILVPSPDPVQRLRQLEAITNAYESMTAEKPELPESDSPMLAALAIQTLRHAISDSKTAMESSLDQLARSETQTNASTAALSDAKLLATALRSRISRLEAAKAEQSSLTAAQRANKAVRAKQRRAAEYKGEAERLRGALERFLRAHVGAMLAAEELGGPVVGTLADVDEDMLVAGFSAQGQPRPPSGRPAAAAGDDAGRRQMRIDEIWGRGGGRGGGGGEPGAPSELRAAGDEISGLVDQLVRALAGESSSGVYVDLRRDSAAARFLVRAKVAQYHPKDARKLRLIDFGRELDS